MNDTVCAVSTPKGIGGISVIRVSGKDALVNVDKIFNRNILQATSHTCTYGKIFNGNDFVDDVVLSIFLAPNSFTGENTVEISCHGSVAVTTEILRLLTDNGCRLAKNGEFTRIAFENGKLSLLQAEAVMEIISAENKSELKFANSLKQGFTYKKISQLKEKLLDINAELSVWADYPDDEYFLKPEKILEECLVLRQEIEKLYSTYDYGKQLKNGVKTAIIGKPNVGKSSLMNVLTGFSRSIVTDIPGTTRDVIEEKINLGSLTLNISDTAGIRKTTDKIEEIGVERSLETLENSDLILAVFDGSRELSEEDFYILESIKNKNAVIIVNKCDLPQKSDIENAVKISAEKGEIDSLISKILEIFPEDKIVFEDGVIANERQREVLRTALENLDKVIAEFKVNQTLDIISFLLTEVSGCFLELTGETVTEAIVSRVFEKFCVGK